ncbi:hypothetical protein [Enterococcus lemanii]|uniref:ABC transporter permease n=1 Tax=Enterococcus lemanii TaxID=1159752 RepID=A0ABV9MT62_9ENTE|nr:hypothetical protein [Enterococcus lemanii]MBM7708554.1 type IV secretory pathway VirB3-like protein [Enterococcus lemanii]
MKRIKQMNIIKLFSVLGISPMVLAIVTYLTANANLVEHSQMNQMILYKEYLMNKIILLPDFKNISYLGGRQVYLLLQPYFFWLLFLLIGAYSYLRQDFRYYQWLAVRSENVNKLYYRMQVKGSRASILFSFVYHATIILLILKGNNYQYQTSNLALIQQMLFIFISHTFLMLGVLACLFNVYLIKGELFFLVSVVIVVAFILMLNLTFPQIALLFLWYENYWLNSLLVGMILFVIAKLLKKKLKFYL